MKFLLAAVNAKYIHSNPAIYSLRAYAGEALQPHIELAEYTINQYASDILADIYRRSPRAIGFSCYIWNWKLIQELVAELPKLLPDTDIWLGGPQASYDAAAILRKYPQTKGIMVGEGEETFKELLEYYVQAGAGDICSIPGLCLHKGYTAHRSLADLDSLPFLYTDLRPFENRIIYYESSRGCPFSCSYCLSSIDKKVRLRDIDIVKKELQFFLDSKAKQVKFVDRTFNCNHEHTLAVWQYIYEHDNGITNFHFEIAGDLLREEEIALLQRFRPGLAQLEIGVQSVNPRTLAAINRVTDLERLKRNVAAVRAGENIHQHLDLIAGLPFEDYESFRNSFNSVYAMKPQQLQLGFLKVLKGTEMYERAQEYGICYLDGAPYEVLYTQWLSYEDVLRLKGVEAMVEVYYNSGQFAHTIAALEKLFESPFAMYEALAEFCSEREGMISSPSRARRYQALLEFAQKWDHGKETQYRELLTLDMYLREKPKSRPDFAAGVSEEEKSAARDFYQKEERERKYLPDYWEYDWKQLGKMTHLEFFRYPAPHAVLFDYRRRNPLNHDAFTQTVESYAGASSGLSGG